MAAGKEDEEADATSKGKGDERSRSPRRRNEGFRGDKIKAGAVIRPAFRDIGSFSHGTELTEGAWKEACNCPTSIGHAA